MSLTITKKQRTIKHSVSLSGAGLFTGENATLTLRPADVGQGIVFVRADLANSPRIPAKLDYVKKSSRCTLLSKDNVSIQTVEHILAAISAYELDNLIVEISGPEVPIFDGSSAVFVEMIEKSGICEQQDSKKAAKLSSPLFWTEGDVHLVALPSDEYRISYTLHYPHSSVLGSQFYSVLVNQEKFKKEIASSRTFCLYEEIAPLVEKGLIKGGGLENAVIIKDNAVLNPEGVRYPDEMVRHKVLDMIGDLSLVAVPFVAHIIAIRSGHASNQAFARELVYHIKMENS